MSSLTLLAYTMIAVFMVLIMTKRLSVLTALVLVPIVFGVIGGFGPKLGPMMLDGIKALAPTARRSVSAFIESARTVDVSSCGSGDGRVWRPPEVYDQMDRCDFDGHVAGESRDGRDSTVRSLAVTTVKSPSVKLTSRSMHLEVVVDTPRHHLRQPRRRLGSAVRCRSTIVMSTLHQGAIAFERLEFAFA